MISDMSVSLEDTRSGRNRKYNNFTIIFNIISSFQKHDIDEKKKYSSDTNKNVDI